MASTDDNTRVHRHTPFVCFLFLFLFVAGCVCFGVFVVVVVVAVAVVVEEGDYIPIATLLLPK